MKFIRLQSGFAAFAVGWMLTVGTADRQGSFLDVSAVRLIGGGAFLGICAAVRVLRKVHVRRKGLVETSVSCSEDVHKRVVQNRPDAKRVPSAESSPSVGPTVSEDMMRIRQRDLAIARDDFAAAAYWETMRNLAFGLERSDALHDIVEAWLDAGCPDLDVSASGLLSIEDYSLGMAVLDYRSEIGVASALSWFVQRAAAGNDESRRWLALTRGDEYENQ